ncbi:CDP-alcohol phosphatidyltransferase family protein [Cognatishimia sp. MH4019]|uniref:CDP-alcohol phosphatidyltransferase family protein n=1 Tax=Cognatishimia sp. MH4019 TaxID=2854030 RepID=UPI001CD66DA8
MRAAFMGGLGVLALAAALPGTTAGSIGFSVVLFAGAAAMAGRFLQRDYHHDRLGLCNYVTLARLMLVCALSAHLLTGGGPSWAFFGLAVIALSLDGVDGWLARKQGLTSEFGARFDVEVDSLLALTLAINAALTPEIGAAALLLGIPRYAFIAASYALPWMQRDLPERFSRKVVCVLQLAALIAMQAPLLPATIAIALVPLVAVALVWSFALDIVWLRRSRS